MLKHDMVNEPGPCHAAGKIVEVELLNGGCQGKYQFGPGEMECVIFTDIRESLKLVDEEYELLERGIEQNDVYMIAEAAKLLMGRVVKTTDYERPPNGTFEDGDRFDNIEA